MRPGRRLDELAPGVGPASIPYARTGQEEPLMGMLSPEQQAQAAASIQPQPDEVESNPTQGGAPTLSAMGGVPGAGQQMSSELPNEALAGMVDPNQDPQVAQVIAAMEDPNTDPRTQQQIQTMLALAARRRLAGV